MALQEHYYVLYYGNLPELWDNGVSSMSNLARTGWVDLDWEYKGAGEERVQDRTFYDHLIAVCGLSNI